MNICSDSDIGPQDFKSVFRAEKRVELTASPLHSISSNCGVTISAGIPLEI